MKNQKFKIADQIWYTKVQNWFDSAETQIPKGLQVADYGFEIK